jgi:hypothetical protein
MSLRNHKINHKTALTTNSHTANHKTALNYQRPYSQSQNSTHHQQPYSQSQNSTHYIRYAHLSVDKTTVTALQMQGDKIQVSENKTDNTVH